LSNSNYDAVIIGGGIAGLSAAAHLAKAGKEVIVFEQHDKPGGYYTSFTRQGIIFDITAHWTVAHEDVNRMLAHLGARPIDFVHHPNIGQYNGPGVKNGILLVNDRERFVRSIIANYPSVKPESIDRLIELSLKVEEEIRSVKMKSPELSSLLECTRMMAQLPFKFKTFLKYARMPGEQFLQATFPGDELKGLRSALYMLAPIKDFSAIGMLLYIGFALRGRAYVPRGEALRAAEAFAQAASANGAEIRYGERVRHIGVAQGRVSGVTLESGESVEAIAVLSAADIRQTFYQLLDPARVPSSYRKSLENTPVSGTFVIVSLVTDSAPAAFGVQAIDTFYTDTADIAEMLAPDDPEHSMISVQFPEFHEPGREDRHHGMQLVAPASYEYKGRWATAAGQASGEAYQQLKEDFAARLIARAERYLPGLSGHILDEDIAIPITLQRYTLNDRGSPVGWSYTSTQRWKQRVPFLPGLYLAGHWVGPSGIFNVAQSGKNAAELIVRDG
jgi:prolycopene isomerase